MEDSIIIRTGTMEDSEAIWEIFRAVVAPGDSFVFSPQTSREEAIAYWFQPESHVYVAEMRGRVVGSYIFKPNQPGLGNHVANAAFMVAPLSRGYGIGKRMGEHCLQEAQKAGFSAMQFNIVVSTNEPAVRLWKQLGFAVVGTLPGVFRHSQHGFVDAYIMFRNLR